MRYHLAMAMDMAKLVARFLRAAQWLPQGEALADRDVTFLAAGEYNENYLVSGARQRFVFRINHGSQLGLDDQIAYEFRVLRALQNSGVTPRPIACALPGEYPWDFAHRGGMGRGVLLMEFLPGKPLDYDRDAAKAARVFARVHAQPADPALVIQADPVADIAAESLGLIERFPDHPRVGDKERLLAMHQEITDLAEQARPLWQGEDMVVVNTEVNSHNFLVHGDEARLVDWEKAVVSLRYQDLGHFLVSTTTRWKTDKVFSREEKRAFLREYIHHAGLELDLDEVERKTRVLERAILLRALSWCFMAWYEYTRGNRALQNADTFARITRYLDELPWNATSGA